MRQGREVESVGLEDRARTARALVFLYADRILVGVAALKCPTVSYRNAKFHAAGVSALKSAYSLELGWVFVPEDHRGRHYSRLLVSNVMSQADNAPLFATTREDNPAMHKSLEHVGFSRVGKPWRSKRGEYDLILYVTPPSSTEMTV